MCSAFEIVLYICVDLPMQFLSVSCMFLVFMTLNWNLPMLSEETHEVNTMFGKYAWSLISVA